MLLNDVILTENYTMCNTILRAKGQLFFEGFLIFWAANSNFVGMIYPYKVLRYICIL